jgi:uncharacterized protein YciI
MSKSSISLFIFILISAFTSCTQTQNTTESLSISESETKRLRAIGDQYGMTQYAICTLKPGKQRLMRVEEFKAIENAHVSYLKSLSDSGIIVLLGFYTSGFDPNSFIIFTSADTSAAKKIMLNAPKIKEQLLIAKYDTWYGPVALCKLREIHEKITAPLPK